jgi:diaminopimelate epimerase
MKLYKAHGLGNDYLVLESGEALDPGRVRAICDRHRGPGADGILEPTRSVESDHGVRIWNPDGSVAEKSGNGLRIFARWLVDERGASRHFTVHTGHEAVTCTVTDEAVAVQMGQARFLWLQRPMTVQGAELITTSLTVGNPHCVCFVDPSVDLDALPWRAWGRSLEVDAAFPNRTNVQVARVLPDGSLEIRIWERGAGETSASGSSSCAVAAAAVRLGLVPDGPILVSMPGGTLDVDVELPGYAITLTGPVAPVCRLELDRDWLRALG